MPKIKLNTDKLVGYTRRVSTETGITKLGTAKLGCKQMNPTTKALPAKPDDRA